MLNSRRLILGIAMLAIVIGGVAFMVRTPSVSVTVLPAYNTIDSPSGAAIKGYDPVAYFVAGAPMIGRRELSVEYGGVRWQFASAENKARFEMEPDKYLPAYGGYCAYGVAQGYLVKIEPEAWAIKDGRLYLNYDAQVQKQWEKDWTGYVETARKSWPLLIKKGSRET